MELNKIYHKSCLEGLKELPDNCVDMIFTDPPILPTQYVILFENFNGVFSLVKYRELIFDVEEGYSL